MSLHRLRGRKTCDYLIRKGQVWKGRTLVIRWLPYLPFNRKEANVVSGLYVGTSASAKLSKSAVERNRMRRRCREALRVLGKEGGSLPPAQLLLCPRHASLDAPFPDILADIRAFLLVLASCPPSARDSSTSPSSSR